MERSMIFGIIGGLGLFLYGMNLAGDGLRRAAGDRMRNILEVLTSTPLKGVLVGMLVTAVMQSSSATTVMLVSFVNAGLMTLRQALGVIMGANIGTTITAQLIAFNLADYALPAIGIGFLIHMVARRKVWKSVGQIVLGFGILFLGLSLMSTSVIPLQDSPAFGKAMRTFGTNPVLGVVIGLVTTLVVQSSAATIGMLMALAISSPDLVTLEVAIPILLGDNIGTCITAILSGIGASVTARRTAMAHLMFNVFGALIFLPFIGPFKWVVEAFTRSGDIQRQIANAHTLFNVANTVIWLPATGFLERVVSWLVPGEDTVVEIGPKYLDRRMLGTPPIALDLAVAETVRMGEIVQEMLDYSRKALTQGYTSQLDSDLESREQLIDDLNREVVLYLSMVAQSSLNEAESRRLAGLMHAVGDVERIGDVAEQLMFYAREKFDQGLTFSETAMKELEGVFDLAEQMLARGVVALRDNDMEAVEDVFNIHKKLDETTNMLRANHIGRLNEGKCVPGSGVIFVELMNSLERMGDLSVNLADAVSGKKSPRVEPRS